MPSFHLLLIRLPEVRSDRYRTAPDQIISFQPSKTTGSVAHLDMSATPAIPSMHTPLHHVAAATAIVGIVVGVVVLGIIVIIVAVVGVRVA
jgi:hypothetical protein